MCRVPAGSLPQGAYAAPTWLESTLAPANAPAGPSAAAAPPLIAAGVPLPAISDAELSMLDSLLNVKAEPAPVVAAAAAAQQQQQQLMQVKPEPGTLPFVASSSAIAPVAPAPPAFLSGVFSSAPFTGGVTHANAAAYGAAVAHDGRGKRAKKSAEEIEAQIERVKKRRRESAQRSRARKSLFVKSLEVENRELKKELFRLRAIVEAALAGGHAIHPASLAPPASFTAAAGAAAAGAAAYFAAGGHDDDDEDEDEHGGATTTTTTADNDSSRADDNGCGEFGASNASTGTASGSPISTDA